MRYFASIIIILIISSCSNRNQETSDPVRLNRIPENAFWIGGVDGGNWYSVLDINSHRNTANIQIYNDQDGSLIISKRFILVCPIRNPTWISNLKEVIVSFDGEKIYLKSDAHKKLCYLQ
jgi:hypothetical protein